MGALRKDIVNGVGLVSELDWDGMNAIIKYFEGCEEYLRDMDDNPLTIQQCLRLYRASRFAPSFKEWFNEDDKAWPIYERIIANV